MKTVQLGDLIRAAGSRAGLETTLPVYSVTKYSGFVPSLEYFKKQVFSRDLAGYKKVEPGDFAYATIHLDEGSIGIAPERGLISPMYTVFKLDQTRADAQYLLRYLRSPRALAQYSMLGRGAVHRRKAISLTALGSLVVPLPPLDEQRRIAAILDQADSIRTKRREALAHLDTLTQSIFHTMFGAITETRPLGGLITEFRYGTSSKSGTDGYPVVRIPNVIGGTIDLSSLKFVPATASELQRLRLVDGDVLLVRSNGNPDNVGRAADFRSAQIPAGDYVFASYLIRARPNPVHLNGVFLATYLASPRGRRALRERAKTSAGQYNVNIEGLASIPVPAASLERQRDFAAREADIYERRSRYLRAIDADDRLFASLQSRAFRGEL